MTSHRRSPMNGRRRLLAVVGLSFAAGALVDGGLRWRVQGTAGHQWFAEGGPVHDTIEAPVRQPGRDVTTVERRETPPPAGARSASAPVGTSGTGGDTAPVDILRSRALDVPVAGVGRSALTDSFSEARGSDRAHEAIDILAPRHTPVIAAADGTIVKLFTSKAGGLTIYQFDPSNTFCFYYAHLDGYADGIAEGDSVKRGQVLGYVGSTGNASADAPHLHFAIFRLTAERQWWKGDPINPYDVLR